MTGDRPMLAKRAREARDRADRWASIARLSRNWAAPEIGVVTTDQAARDAETAAYFDYVAAAAEALAR